MKTSTPALTFLLILSMTGLQPAQAEPDPPEEPPQWIENCGWPCAAFAIIVAGGIYVGVKLKNFCNKHLPPTPPPPPPPPPPACTNCPATNAPPKKLLMMADTATDVWDIAYYGWNDHEGYRYSVLVHANIEGSTNLVNWDALVSLKSWVSISNVLTVIYNPTGMAVATNYTKTGTDGIPLGMVPSMGGEPAQARYFRLKTPIH